MAVPYLAAAAALVVGGCAGDRGLTWGFRFAEPADRTLAVYVEAAILRGGCDGAVTWHTDLTVASGMAMDVPPELAAGEWSFRGRARDSGCFYVAAGCETVTLPPEGSDPLIVTLDHLDTPESACASGACTAGVCAMDGGTPDGGATDAPSSTDAGLTDGNVADVLVPVPDGCVATTEACNGMDEDCDGHVDEGFVFATDVNNCGSCGNDCGEASCVSGTCACDPPYEYISRRCVDTARDPGYCGVGHMRCADTEYCSAGACTCRPGLTRSGAVCVDLQVDPANCGSPGNVCTSPQVCSMGSCVASCGASLMMCGMACTNTDTDPNHCGDCVRDCSYNQVCNGGECTNYRPAVGCSSCPCPTGCTGSYNLCRTFPGLGAICLFRD